MRSTQHVEDPVQPFFVHHVADPNKVQVAGRDPNYQVLLGDDAKYEVLPVLAFDLSGLDILDDRCAVIWVNNRFADGKCHVPSTPS